MVGRLMQDAQGKARQGENMDTTQSTTLTPRLPESLAIAGFWRRVGALFIDSMLMGAVG